MPRAQLITPELITAFAAALIAVLGGIVTAILQLRQVHRAVNSNMSDALSRISGLHERLTAAHGNPAGAAATHAELAALEERSHHDDAGA